MINGDGNLFDFCGVEKSHLQQNYLGIAMENLSAAEQKDMKQFIENETGRFKIQAAISDFTDKCWNKCMKNGSMKDSLSSSDTTCLQNCVSRFLDVNIHSMQYQGAS